MSAVNGKYSYVYKIIVYQVFSSINTPAKTKKCAFDRFFFFFILPLNFTPRMDYIEYYLHVPSEENFFFLPSSCYKSDYRLNF